jgi:hypothetical protein
MQIAVDRKNERKCILELAAQEFKEPKAPKISALESIAKVCKKLRMDNEYKLAMEVKKREEAQLIDVAREIWEAVRPVSTIHYWGDDVMVNLEILPQLILKHHMMLVDQPHLSILQKDRRLLRRW